MNEQLSTDQLRRVLETEHGIVFFPKRPLIVPEVDSDRLAELALPGKIDLALENIDDVQRYLEGEAVGDGWGSNHGARRKWRAQLILRYGEPFLDLYYRNNQFRGNRLGLTRLSIRDLGSCMRDQQLTEAFGELGNQVSLAIRGYNGIEALEDKLVVVHFIEDRSIEALELLV